VGRSCTAPDARGARVERLHARAPRRRACGRSIPVADPDPGRSASARPAGTTRAARRPLLLAAEGERCAKGTAAFLAAMHAAADHGATRVPAGESVFRRACHPSGAPPGPQLSGDDPTYYEVRYVLTTERTFPSRARSGAAGNATSPASPTAASDPIRLPVEARLIAEPDAVLRANGVAAGPPLAPY
jgi:hypothetical protein